MSDEKDPKGATAGAVPGARVPDLYVEKLALGELSSDEAKALHARLAAEPDGAARLAAVRASNDEVLVAHPPAEVARDIEDRLRQARARHDDERGRAGAHRASWWLSVPALAAAAVALLVVLPNTLPSDDGSAGLPTDGPVTVDDGVRTKGLDPGLRVFARGEGEPRALRQGDLVRAGDVLQLAYVAAGARYGAIVSVDGRGEITVHLPAAQDPAVAAALEQRGVVSLSHAYALDDAPGFERFFFVTSSSPFAVGVVSRAVRELGGDARHGAPPLPAGLSVDSLVVAKERLGPDAAALER